MTGSGRPSQKPKRWLPDKITAYRRGMVLNDEAHLPARSGGKPSPSCMKLFWLTAVANWGRNRIFPPSPKDNKGQLFKRIVWDTPLSESEVVDAHYRTS